MNGICPDCGEKVALGKQVKIGRQIDCEACDAFLEVVKIDPIQLEWVTDAEFDDDDAYEEEDQEHEYALNW